MKPRWGSVALGGLAAALAAIIVAELFSITDDGSMAAVDPVTRSPQPAAEPPHAAFTRSADWAVPLLARPLFKPDRRPDTIAPRASVSSGTSTNLPRLAGILISADGRRAIFQSGGDDKPLVMGEGEDIAGWTIKQIFPTSVILTGRLGTQTLEPNFDPNAKVTEIGIPAQPPPPPPPPGAQNAGGILLRTNPRQLGVPANPRYLSPSASGSTTQQPRVFTAPAPNMRPSSSRPGGHD